MTETQAAADNFEQAINVLADLIGNSKTSVAFTGAGISTESGIPDFRSPNGVWAKRQPVMFNDFMDSADARFEYWSQKSESHPEMRDASPNVAHVALAEWQSNGNLRGVITQNIDGLHQDAGSTNVLELHGTAREVSCLDCGHSEDADPLVRRFLQEQTVPQCPKCDGGRMKHATVSFGQSLPEDVIQTAAQWSGECDLFVVIGSSLVVHPAAGLPVHAQRSGADLVIINRDPTPLDDIATLIIRRSIGETFTRLKACDAV